MKLPIATIALFAALAASSAPAQDTQNWRHAIALDGEPKYGEDFTAFDYVNPDAPKGGSVRLSALGTFDSFNPILLRVAPPRGSGWSMKH